MEVDFGGENQVSEAGRNEGREWDEHTDNINAPLASTIEFAGRAHSTDWYLLSNTSNIYTLLHRTLFHHILILPPVQQSMYRPFVYTEEDRASCRYPQSPGNYACEQCS